MNTKDKITLDFFQIFYANKAISNINRSKKQMSFLYDRINFTGKNVLDIGGGSGTHSFYAAYHGANNVICLEPESDGSKKGAINSFNRIKKDLELYNISLIEQNIQNFDANENKFDIIILHNSINHLNEDACVKLHYDIDSLNTYIRLLSKIDKISSNSSQNIIFDCSRINFFPYLKLKNFFDKNIEWHKHQPPDLWIKLFSDLGFKKSFIRWSSPTKLGKIGRLIFNNKFMSFFYTSHFCITLEKTSNQKVAEMD